MSLPASEVVGGRERFQFQCVPRLLSHIHACSYRPAWTNERGGGLSQSLGPLATTGEKTPATQRHTFTNHGKSATWETLQCEIRRGGRDGAGPRNPIFSLPLCHRQKSIRLLVKTDLWSSECDCFMRPCNTKIHAGQCMPSKISLQEAKHS